MPDLINQLLVNRGFIDSTQWTGILAEVTIHHRQTVTLMADDGSGSDGSYSLDAGSRFALVRSVCAHGLGHKPSSISIRQLRLIGTVA